MLSHKTPVPAGRYQMSFASSFSDHQVRAVVHNLFCFLYIYIYFIRCKASEGLKFKTICYIIDFGDYSLIGPPTIRTIETGSPGWGMTRQPISVPIVPPIGEPTKMRFKKRCDDRKSTERLHVNRKHCSYGKYLKHVKHGKPRFQY